MPLPRPRFEIFVYSPRLEGVHLRAGKVARGGLRWSDRLEDFRTEILGLLKAQRVKNVVIVPEGAKGGFVVKRPPGDGGTEALLAEGIECYRLFIHGLLDLTDNIKKGQIVPPRDVLCWDEADPYLVVAADKGTAAFSDIANRVSQASGFWLDDAFASGGSAGYDHKKMGITARGAWEAVKRHFREMGIDTQSQDITVVGVGDMAGDVFGNGMLLSRHIKLLGAFNHRHIFVDPDPDPELSRHERQRLFVQPGSTWSDYNAALLAKGGGIFERRAKVIRLTPEIQQVFAITKDAVTPNELIQALLRAPVDLLWFGGIGTFVKAGTESHAEAGDRSNDAIRIDARELRCRVIGEGANLGLTQRARIEYALRGGRINTDAIDNAAGVNCSDHEVNIKIALNAAVATGRLTRERRDTLLMAMTDEVARLVLRDNYLQTQAISLAQAQAVESIDRKMRVMQVLERGGQLNRAIEFLPDDDTLSQRRTAGLGLTRPEIAVLLAYTKLAVYNELLASDLPDNPLLAQDLVHYFPAPMREDYRDFLEHHPLRREIIATSVVNSMINRVGSGFVNDMQEKLGVSDADVARAYAVTRDVFDLRTLWEGIEALDNRVPAALQTALMLETNRLVEHMTLWFLRNGDDPLNMTTTAAQFGPGIAILSACLDTVLTPEEQATLNQCSATYVEQGVPPELARRIASLEPLTAGCDIVQIAQASGVPLPQAGRLYFAVGARFGLAWMRAQAGQLTPEGYWHKHAIAALIDDLYAQQRALTACILTPNPSDDANAVLETWIAKRFPVVKRLEQRLNELKAFKTLDISMLIVASHQCRPLLEQGLAVISQGDMSC